MALNNAEKSRENLARRAAERQGFTLSRSRRRDPRSIHYGTYGLYSAYTNVLEAGDTNTGYGLTIDDVERILNRDPA